MMSSELRDNRKMEIAEAIAASAVDNITASSAAPTTKKGSEK